MANKRYTYFILDINIEIQSNKAIKSLFNYFLSLLTIIS